MKVIIIGSGIAGVTFAEKLRQNSTQAQITVLTKETLGYYSRPLLSMGFSDDDIEEDIIVETFSELLEKDICVISGVDVTGINRAEQSVSIQGRDEIESLPFDLLVLATGSSAFIPPPFIPFKDCFFLLNSLVDLKTLRKFRQSRLDAGKQPEWAIVGGGLIGCEVASDLALAGDKVSIYHAMDRLMERQLEEADSETLLKVLQDDGISVHFNQMINGFAKKTQRALLQTEENETEFDGIIVSCGFKPRTELATQAGLETGRGIKTNQYLQTSDEHIYALGDVAELPNGKLYAFIKPIRHQAIWLADFLTKQHDQAWSPPDFNPSAKINNFTAAQPYLF